MSCRRLGRISCLDLWSVGDSLIDVRMQGLTLDVVANVIRELKKCRFLRRRRQSDVNFASG